MIESQNLQNNDSILVGFLHRLLVAPTSQPLSHRTAQPGFLFSVKETEQTSTR